MKSWAALRQLTWAQWWTMLVAMVLLPLFALVLRRTSLARFVARMHVSGSSRPGAVADALAAGRAVNLVATRLRSTCLTRSLVLQWLLSRRGIGSVLRVGVRNEGDGLHAHAWVECDGSPVNDTVEGMRDFAPLGLP